LKELAVFAKLAAIEQVLPAHLDVGNASETANISSPARFQRPSPLGMLRQLASRTFAPRHLLTLARLANAPRADRKSRLDAELQFCADVLPGDFINYGFYEDASLPPEQISLHTISQAQLAYGRLLMAQITDKARPVLDAGCGMGGLLNLLVADGFDPVALTPNHAQAEYIRRRHASVRILEGKCDLRTLETWGGHFGTVVTSESFQYMKLAPGLRTVAHVLAPGGRWVLCDYFRIAPTRRNSGHQWTDFTRAAQENGWRIVSERDITAHAMPTLRYLHMLGSRVGGAAADFMLGKLKRKRPALHYLVEGVVQDWRGYIDDQVRTVDPDVFVREKKYMLLVLERA
jgi:SAM-dependent methyltransferase